MKDSNLLYCGDDCLSTGDPNLKSIPAAMANNFPSVSASDFVAYIQPNMGHAINLHYNATGAYNVLQKIFGSKGVCIKKAHTEIPSSLCMIDICNTWPIEAPIHINEITTDLAE